MVEHTDGGQAFPGEQGEVAGLWNQTWDPGMSLLEYFAAHAPESPDWWWSVAKAGAGNLTPEAKLAHEVAWTRAWARAQIAYKEMPVLSAREEAAQ